MSRILALLAGLLLMPGFVRAAAGEGTAGGLLARLPVGARSQALGGAHGALPDSPEVLVVNASSLRMLESARVEAAYHQGLEDLYHSGLLIGVPLKDWLVLAGGVQMFSAGMLEARTHVGEPVSAQLQEDRMGMLGAGIGRGPLSLGAAFKYYHSRLVESLETWYLLGDIGAGYRFAFPNASSREPTWLNLSAALGNLGASYSYDTETGEEDRPPTVVRLGASAGRKLVGDQRVLAIVSADLPRHTSRLEGRCGLEIVWPFPLVELAARGGFRGRNDSGQFSAGLGLRYLGLDLDYAFVTAREPFGATHHVSAAVSFERFRPAPPPLAE